MSHAEDKTASQRRRRRVFPQSETARDRRYAHARVLCRWEIAYLVSSTMSSERGEEDEKEYPSQVGVMEC